MEHFNNTQILGNAVIPLIGHERSVSSYTRHAFTHDRGSLYDVQCVEHIVVEPEELNQHLTHVHMYLY